MSQKRKYNKLHDSDKFATQYIRSHELKVHSSPCYLKNEAFLGCTLLPSISSHRVQTNIYHTADNIISDVICTTLWTIPHTRRLTNRAADLKNILFLLNCIFYCGMWPLQGQIASECWLHHYLWIIDLREWNYGLISSRKWGRESRWELTLCCVWTFLASLCGLSRGLYARAVVPYDWSGAVGLAKPFCRTIWKERKSQWLFLRINCLLCNGTTVSRKTRK